MPVANPVFEPLCGQLEEALREAEAEAEAHVGQIADARAHIAELDAQKKEFATLAEEALGFVKGERASVDGRVKGLAAINPDDAEAIANGNEQLGWLVEYASRNAERAARLDGAKRVSDSLMAAAEMDNPYTRQSMASLNSAVDQLEKLVRDAISLVEGQLARANASITPEQKSELQEAFHHFDRTDDGKLNKVEYGAAMKSLDFAGAETDAEFAKHARQVDARTADGEQKVESCIDFDAFLTIVLQQYKSKDTMDGLLSAFRAIANGKETVMADDLKNSLKPADAEFLAGRLTPAGDGFDYVPFVNAVYSK